MKRFHLISMALLLVVSAVACDDAVPGAGEDLGGIWFGSMSSQWGDGTSVSVSTPEGVLRTVTLIGFPAPPAEMPADLGPILEYDQAGPQIVLRGMSESGGVSSNLISFIDYLSGDNVAGLVDRLSSGLTATTVEIYDPLDYSPPAGIEPDYSNFKRFELICDGAPLLCFADSAIAKGSDVASLLSIGDGEGAEEVLVHEGAYQQPIYEAPSDLSLLNGYWFSLDAPILLSMNGGAIDGEEEGACLYGGSFSLMDPTRNVYGMNLVVTNCGDSGSYNGLAVIVEDAESGGPFLIFQVDNGSGMMLADIMEYDGEVLD